MNIQSYECDEVRYSIYEIIAELGKITGPCLQLCIDQNILFVKSQEKEFEDLYWNFDDGVTTLKSWEDPEDTHKIIFDEVWTLYERSGDSWKLVEISNI